MSQYLILIYENERAWAEADPDTVAKIHAGHGAFAQANGGKVAGGNALRPTTTATTLRPDGLGGATVTDGPFTETKEALGGYYLVDAADLDEALAIARQVPVNSGGVEVRPILEMDF